MTACPSGHLEGLKISQDEELDLACDLGTLASFLAE